MLLDSWGGSFGNRAGRAPRCSCWPLRPHEEDLEPRAPDAGAGRRGRVHHQARGGRPDPDQRLGQPGDGRRRARAPRARWSCRRTSSRSAASGPALAVAAAGSLDPMGLTVRTAGLLLDAGDLSSREEGDLREVAAGDERQRLPLRRARLPERQRDEHRAGHPVQPRRRADAGRHPDRDVPRALRRATRTWPPSPPSGPRRGPAAAVAAAYALVVGFVGALLGRRSASSPGSRSPIRSPRPRGRPGGWTRGATRCPVTSSTCRGRW